MCWRGKNCRIAVDVDVDVDVKVKSYYWIMGRAANHRSLAGLAEARGFVAQRTLVRSRASPELSSNP
ncbi:MAG: hypothetical protein LBH93_02745 [Chitinispirillales bacterium]|nr:hypothetical protein [Chitinispirillales bacterium]